MTDEKSIELIRESAIRFACANISWDKARFGIFGIWVVREHSYKSETDTLSRAKQSAYNWYQIKEQELKNPYNPIVSFLESGGRFGRWEEHFLDIYCPSGNKCRLPEKIFAMF